MRSFQFSDARSHKFWQIDVQGRSFTVTYGKVGTAGQTQTKTFLTPQKARDEADKLIKEKLKKGYTETTPRAGVSTGEALEAAVRANPDDRAARAAYADYLTEQGDPRGESIQVQLALEDEYLPAAERKKLQAREKELLKKHRRQWVGPWADHPRVGESTREWSAPRGWVPYTFTRGLLTGVEVGELSVGVARELLKALEVGFLRELTVHGFDYYDEDADDQGDLEGDNPSMYLLARWPRLRQVRVFRFGGAIPSEYDDYCHYRCHVPGDMVSAFVKQMPDIEELHVMAHFREDMNKLASLPMPRLRTLLLYHGWNYPLEKLAKNPTLTSLRELYCRPHAQEHGDDPYIRLLHLRALCRSKHLTSLTHLQLRMADFGDKGVEEIVKAGLLRRLKVLDLRHGLVTDGGAEALAESPDLKNLDFLDLSWNRLTRWGVAALERTGISASLAHQQLQNAESWETFHHGDIE
jgi:uncharacterized protein (TIGR02996 family)